MHNGKKERNKPVSLPSTPIPLKCPKDKTSMNQLEGRDLQLTPYIARNLAEEDPPGESKRCPSQLVRRAGIRRSPVWAATPLSSLLSLLS